MKKRILTLVMTVILVVTQVAVPVTSFAAAGDSNTPSSYGYDETPADSVTVEVTISNDGIPLMGLDAAETPLAHLEVTVPYFDLELYDLQQYYRYGTENGQGKYINDKVVERPTALHLYIYLLERYYLGIPEEDCGTGLQKVLNVSGNKPISYYDGMHAYDTKDFNSLTLTGSATSMYMFNFWGHDENLMYYRNHRYPLMSPGWGSCADYILLSEGDRIEVAMFTDWSFYHTGAFLSFDKDDYNAVPGQPLTVQLRGTATTPENKDEDKDNDGVLTPDDVKDQPETPILPYTEDDVDVALYNENWERSEAEVTSNDDGTYTIQMPRRVGTYYVMATDADGGTDGANKSPGIAKIVSYDADVEFELKKDDAKDEIEWYVDLDEYRELQQAELNAIIDSAWAKIDAITDKSEADKIDQIVAEAKAVMAAVKTDEQLKAEEAAAAEALAKAKETAKAEIAGYKTPADYRAEQQAELTEAVEVCKAAIASAKSIEEVNKAVADAKAAMDQIKTDAQLDQEEEEAAAAVLAKAKEEAKAEIAGYKNAADYRDAQKAELNVAIEAANKAIDAATSETSVKKAVTDAKTAMDQIKTDAQLKAEEEAVHQHSYVNETADAKYLAAAATCTEAAKYYKSCACGEKGTEIFTFGTALDHDYSDTYTVDKAASTTKNGSKSKHCTRCDAKTSVKTIYKLATAKLGTTTYTYDGKVKSPKVILKDSKGNTISSKNYTVTKAKGRKNVGKYTYKVTFKNEYKGIKAKTLTFKINPKATKITSLTKGKKSFTVKWSKKTTQTTGYQIYYSTSKTRTNGKKITISKNTTTKKTISKLKGGKKYYVWVRTYKTVDGKKYYSDWSARKYVTTKK